MTGTRIRIWIFMIVDSGTIWINQTPIRCKHRHFFQPPAFSKVIWPPRKPFWIEEQQSIAADLKEFMVNIWIPWSNWCREIVSILIDQKGINQKQLWFTVFPLNSFYKTVTRNDWSNMINGYTWFSLLYLLIDIAWKATFGCMSAKQVFQFKNNIHVWYRN